MRGAWRAAGRTEPLYSTQFALGCVLKNGEPADSPRAIAQAGPLVAVLFHNLVETTSPGSMAGVLPDPVNAALEQYRKIYNGYEPADARYLHESPRPSDVRQAGGAAAAHGAADRIIFVHRYRRTCCSIGCARSKAAGYSQFTIQMVEGQEAALEDWSNLFERL